MEEKMESSSVYKNIIWNYVNSINTQINIVPLFYSFLSAQILADRKKVEKFRKEHGTPIENDGGEGIRRTCEEGSVF